MTCDCGATWEQDPVFMVGCPVCEAGPGEKCRRPSGHLVWNTGWNGLPKGAHPKRDIEALRNGAYDRCTCDDKPDSVADLPPDNPYSPHYAPDTSDATATQPTLFDQ